MEERLHLPRTGGFSQKNFLSECGFGSVFRGDLGELKIAVKQHKSASFQGEKEFKAEVNVLSTARLENLVMLSGSCSEGTNRLLVYEFVFNGSLDQHLSNCLLSWEKRMKVALGAAKGLQYLHENSIVHRDMRPNNILITHDHEALLGDFGLARTQHDDSDHSGETRVVGTLGYLASEFAECREVSTKTDVYSFRVVLLQVITGLKTTGKILRGKSLIGWATPLLKEKNYPDLIDPRILDSHDIHQFFWMVRVAEKCLCKDPRKRLPMNKVVLTFNGINDYSPAQSNSVSSTPESCDS
ncbi:Protein kinase superfamily protein [Euphorbia peplus]|nr:Protein kinase superfamily protein [Euphorbia peplus]